MNKKALLGGLLLASSSAFSAEETQNQTQAQIQTQPQTQPQPQTEAHPPSAPTGGIMETYPDLQKLVYAQRESNLYFGVGISPVTLLNNRIGFGLNLFELHWIKDRYDIEAFSISFGTAFGQTYGNEQNFLIRTVPKYKVFKNISVGPLLGLEFVHFSEVTDELNRNNLYTKPFEFSTTGMVYGAAACETFTLNKNYLIKINQNIYKETYGYLGTSNGWQYYYLQNALNTDPSPIAASTVFQLEISLLY